MGAPIAEFKFFFLNFLFFLTIMTKKGSSSSGGGSLEALLERKVSGWIDQFYSGGQERLAPLDEQDALVAYIHGRDASWKRKPEKKLRQLIERGK